MTISCCGRRSRRWFFRTRGSSGACSSRRAWRRRPGWTKQAPDLLSAAFTEKALRDFLQRRRKAPLKAVLLMQERFPGIGNWMADEILWRAGIHPAQPAGSVKAKETKALYRDIRGVCRDALAHHRPALGRSAGFVALQAPLEKRRHLPEDRREAPARHHRRTDDVLVAGPAEAHAVFVMSRGVA